MKARLPIAALAAAVLVGGAASAATIYGGVAEGDDLNNDPYPDAFMDSPALAKCDQGAEDQVNGSCAGSFESEFGDAYLTAFDVEYLSDNSFNWSFDPDEVTGVSSVLYPTKITVKFGSGGGNFGWVWYNVDLGDTSGFVDVFADSEGLFRNAISHVSFYDTGAPAAVPLPAAGWLLLVGIGGLGALTRRGRS